MEPWISSENFICTLSCESHLVVLYYLGAEIEHGGFHICHARQISGIHSLEQTVHLGHIVALQKAVVCACVLHHFFYPWTVKTGLEGVRFEKFLIVFKIKGEGV